MGTAQGLIKILYTDTSKQNFKNQIEEIQTICGSQSGIRILK